MSSPPDPAQFPARIAPHPHLSLLDSTSIIVGIIIGSSIFLSVPLIANNLPSAGWLIGAWVIGAVFTLLGALCYAELATAYPREGGDYVFLSEAFGRRAGFLFAWTQFWIVRPGSIGTVAFVFADYANRLFPLPAIYQPTLLYSIGAIVVLSGINLLGVRAGKWTQNLLTLVKYLGLVAIVVVGLCLAAPAPIPAPVAASAPSGGAPPMDLGFALIFIFYAYGGWNEMAYVSAEVRHPQKNILRALVLGTVAVTVVYIAVNLAFVHCLGFAALRRSEAVAADVLTLCVGSRAGQCISLLICITALGGINGMVFTGARIFYAMGADHRFFAWLGRWSAKTDTPALPLLVQAAVTVAVTLGFGWNQSSAHGFSDSVAFYAPAFWLFLYLIGHAVFVLRTRSPADQKTYRVPFYPLVPLLFCLNSGFMFFKSLDWAILTTPRSLWASVAVIALGALVTYFE